MGVPYDEVQEGDAGSRIIIGEQSSTGTQIAQSISTRAGRPDRCFNSQNADGRGSARMRADARGYGSAGQPQSSAPPLESQAVEAAVSKDPRKSASSVFIRAPRFRKEKSQADIAWLFRLRRASESTTTPRDTS